MTQPCAEQNGLSPSSSQPPVNGSSGAMGRLWRNERFRRLWIAQFVSGVGDWLVIGFLMPLVTTLSGGSSFAVAGILIAKILPSLLFSTVIGVLVDRFDRKRVMVAADLVRAFLTLGLLFTNSLWMIYIIVALMETASLCFYPARNALIPYLVEEEDVTQANGLAYTTQQASMLIGLTASGAILAGFEAAVRAVLTSGLPVVQQLAGYFAPTLLGPRAGVAVNSLTFLFSAAVISTIAVRSRPAAAEGELSLDMIGKDVIESFRFLGAHPELRAFLTTIFLAILGGGAIVPVGLVYVQQNLTGSVPFLDQVPQLEALIAAPQTFMLVFLALGMVVGAIVVPRFEGQVSLQLLFAGGVTAFGLAMLGFASVNTYAIACIFAIAAGASIATVSVAGNTYVVRTVADEIRGRVFTALESVIRVALLTSMIVMAPIGDLLSGVVRRVVEAQNIAPASVNITGSRVTLQIASFIVLGAAAYAWRNLSWRRCEITDVPDVPAPAEGGSAESAGPAGPRHAAPPDTEVHRV